MGPSRGSVAGRRALKFENGMSGAKVCTGDFAPPIQGRIQGRILGNEFWTPEFWTRILGSNFLTLFFPAKEEAPRKIHP